MDETQDISTNPYEKYSSYKRLKLTQEAKKLEIFQVTASFTSLNRHFDGKKNQISQNFQRLKFKPNAPQS